MDFRTIWLAGILPATVCAAVLVLVWRPWRQPPATITRAAGSSLAFVAALTVSAGMLLGWPRIPPAESWQWLVYLGLLGALPGLAGSASGGLGVCTALASAAAGAWWIVPKWQEPRGWWVAALAGTVMITFSLEPLARRRQGFGLPLTLFALSIASSAVLLLSGNLKLALLAGIIAACCGAAAVIGIWDRSFSLAGGPAGIVAIMLPCLLMSGQLLHYSEIPNYAFYLPVLSLLALWVGEIGWIRRLGGLKSGAITLLVALIPLLVCGVEVYRAEAE